MNLNDLLLRDFHNASVLDMYLIMFGFMMVGASILLLILAIFKVDINDYYKKGQIDYAKGKIKYKSVVKEVYEQIKH